MTTAATFRATSLEPGEAPGAQPFVLPQFGIFAQGMHAHHFLELDLNPDVTAAGAVSAFCQLATPDVASGGVNIVVAFGAETWRAVSPGAAPADLAPFVPVTGREGRTAPATQHDAWLWISGAEPAVTWHSARAAAEAVGPAAHVAAEQTAFTYRGGRDTTGFVDGTANPPDRRAPEVALVQPGRPGAGGSHVLAMRWLHDLPAFEQLPVDAQERVIGRTKNDSVELPPDRKPRDAHIARVETTVDGRELEILRRSVPFGTSQAYGLYFVAFSAERDRYDRMLARMFGVSGDGVRDRLTDFSRPVSGAYYFAPSLAALDAVAGPD